MQFKSRRRVNLNVIRKMGDEFSKTRVRKETDKGGGGVVNRGKGNK